MWCASGLLAQERGGWVFTAKWGNDQAVGCDSPPPPPSGAGGSVDGEGGWGSPGDVHDGGDAGAKSRDGHPLVGVLVRPREEPGGSELREGGGEGRGKGGGKGGSVGGIQPNTLLAAQGRGRGEWVLCEGESPCFAAVCHPTAKKGDVVCVPGGNCQCLHDDVPRSFICWFGPKQATQKAVKYGG